MGAAAQSELLCVCALRVAVGTECQLECVAPLRVAEKMRAHRRRVARGLRALWRWCCWCWREMLCMRSVYAACRLLRAAAAHDHDVRGVWRARARAQRKRAKREAQHSAL